ncbi:MAG: hypothetical protein ACI4XO_04965, partial [Akkermansia sp.]
MPVMRFFLCFLACLSFLCSPQGMGEDLVEMKYRDPQAASYLRMRQPVSIELLPEWGLSPQQAEFAARPPMPGRGATQSCFRYPEDIKP